MAGIAETLYKRAFRPFLFLFSPDKAHSMTVSLLNFLGRVPGFAPVVRFFLVRRHKELAFDWRGIHFDSPIGLGAGLDKNGRMIPMMRAFGHGFTTVGSVTARPCKGNERPWFYRLLKTQSMVVNVGLANEGSKAVLARLNRLPKKYQQYPTVLSVARTNDQKAASDEAGIADYVTTVKRAIKSPAVQIIELNISCPNAFCGETFNKPELFEKLLVAVRATGVQKPLLVKLPVDLPWTHLKKLLDIMVRYDIAGVTVSNLLKNRSMADIKDPLTDDMAGNLSGAPLRELSTELIRKIHTVYGDKLTIFGIGGVLTAEDAYEKIQAGATFVEVVTGMILKGPFVESELRKGLIRRLNREGLTQISEVPS